ncbi:MAG: 2-oxoglutarate:ferredoxin oxidoreductase [Nitrospinae bacterium]|nr:2-oxoglutarate:ferredoxin oxidoreductase [Nitrospinota bacterium]
MPKLDLGPIGLLPASAAAQGIFQPEKDSGFDLVEGEHVPTDDAITKAAHEILTRRNPTLFPGPMIVWGWTEETDRKAELAMDLVKEVPGMNVITMPDYRPIYPKIDPETVINPCHPNLTIQHNKIESCILIGIHCHFANITLKMIRANTNCYTMAFCAYDGHEDALLSLRDLDGSKLKRVTEAVRKAKKDGVEPWAYTKEGKEELEEIAARKKAEAAPAKEDTVLFMGELEQGLDEHAE